MSPEGIAALIGLGVYAAMRLIDAFLPSGRHFTFVDRWLAKDKNDPKEVTDE